MVFSLKIYYTKFIHSVQLVIHQQSLLLQKPKTTLGTIGVLSAV